MSKNLEQRVERLEKSIKERMPHPLQGLSLDELQVRLLDLAQSILAKPVGTPDERAEFRRRAEQIQQVIRTIAQEQMEGMLREPGRDHGGHGGAGGMPHLTEHVGYDISTPE